MFASLQGLSAPAAGAALGILVEHRVELRMHHVGVFRVQLAFERPLGPRQVIVATVAGEAVVAHAHDAVPLVHDAGAHLCGRVFGAHGRQKGQASAPESHYSSKQELYSHYIYIYIIVLLYDIIFL